MTGYRDKKPSINDMFFPMIALSIYIGIIEIHMEVEV